jgi:hypothetical protein
VTLNREIWYYIYILCTLHKCIKVIGEFRDGGSSIFSKEHFSWFFSFSTFNFFLFLFFDRKRGHTVSHILILLLNWKKNMKKCNQSRLNKILYNTIYATPEPLFSTILTEFFILYKVLSCFKIWLQECWVFLWFFFIK